MHNVLHHVTMMPKNFALKALLIPTHQNYLDAKFSRENMSYTMTIARQVQFGEREEEEEGGGDGKNGGVFEVSVDAASVGQR